MLVIPALGNEKQENPRVSLAGHSSLVSSRAIRSPVSNRTVFLNVMPKDLHEPGHVYTHTRACTDMIFLFKRRYSLFYVAEIIKRLSDYIEGGILAIWGNDFKPPCIVSLMPHE